MISAKEAQQKTDSVIEERNKKLLLELDPILNDIDEKINQAINNGTYLVQVAIPKTLNKWQLNQLVDRYHRLKYDTRLITAPDYSIYICWAKETPLACIR